MPRSSRLAVSSVLVACLLAGCRVQAPEKANDAITLMAKYDQQGRYDDAITVAQDWLKKHPDDPSHGSGFYEQIALAYLMKASRDTAHKDEWIQQAVAYYDRDLVAHQKTDVDIELYSVGRGLELAGDLSTRNGCLYYGRAIQAFEQEVQFIQGDSYTAYGATIPLAPVRQENEKALVRVKAKFEKVNCK